MDGELQPRTELEWIKAIHADVSAMRKEFADLTEDVATAKSLEPRVTAIEHREEERSRNSLLVAIAFIAPLLTALIGTGVAVAHI